MGVEWLAHPKTTLVVDLVGRRLMKGGRLEYESVATPNNLGTVDILLAQPKGFTVLSLAPGVKHNIAGNLLINANVLLSVANHGLRGSITPTIGVDWLVR
jgi:hypothetical protein